jgi:hypothetical protein
MAVTFKTGSVYSFTTINANILGGTFEKVKLSGIVDYNTAKLLSPNIDSVQASVFPYLPQGTSDKHTSYQYYVFQKQTEGISVFAIEWINMDTVRENSVEYLDIRISGANPSDIATIKNILGLSGWPVVNEIT